MTPYTLKLPMPPSLNAYYENATRTVRRGPKAGMKYTGRKVSAEGMAFRTAVAAAVRAGHRTPPRFTGRLNITLYVCPPDEKVTGAKNRNVRDMDNLWKGLLDALTLAGVVADDCLYDRELVIRGNPVRGGASWVVIERFDPDAAALELAALGIIVDGDLFSVGRASA